MFQHAVSGHLLLLTKAQSEALEKLMETGWVRPTTTSCVTSPDNDETPGGSVAVDPTLQRDALEDADVTHQLYNPAIPQNLPPENSGVTPVQTQTPALPREDEPLSGDQAGLIAALAASNSNAFEGALDGSNFVGLGGIGSGMEPFNMDSSSWYTGDWMEADPSRHGGLM